MATFPQLIPEVDDLLAMHTEELAEYVLKLAAEHRQNGLIHLQAMQALVERRFPGEHCYPPNREQEALGAIAEAWGWLQSNGVLIPDFGPNGSNGFVRLSRNGARMLEDDGFARFLQDVQFPKTLLHPKIANSVWGDLIRGELDTAVFKAFKAVEVAVRDLAEGVPPEKYGVDLVRLAFNPNNGPLANTDTPIAEREALANLFAGAIGSYKNPHSHRTVAITEPLEAQEQVLLASHLLRIVESRMPAD